MIIGMYHNTTNDTSLLCKYLTAFVVGTNHVIMFNRTSLLFYYDRSYGRLKMGM